MPILTETRVIQYEPNITIIYSEYANAGLMFITQINKLGTFIHAYAENPEEPAERRVYAIETKFGERNDE